MRMRSPLDWLPNRVMARSWASLPGSMGRPTSGTHSCTPKCSRRGSEGELVAVEGALRLADDDRVESAVGVALSGQRAAVTDVEVLGDDHATLGLDELAGSAMPWRQRHPAGAAARPGRRTRTCGSPRTPPARIQMASMREWT